MEPSNHKKGQHLNLRNVAQNFMDGLQRHADMLAFNLAARESVQEAAYKQRSLAPRIMPAGKRHQNFEQMHPQPSLRPPFGEHLLVSLMQCCSADVFCFTFHPGTQKIVSPRKENMLDNLQARFC